MKMSKELTWLPSELVTASSCIDHCNAAHRNSSGRIWCGVMSHGDGICLHGGQDLVAEAERVRRKMAKDGTENEGGAA